MARVREVEMEARNLIRAHIPRLKVAESHPDDDRRLVQSVYLGTVLNIMPSRKFYTPWAISNLEDCKKYKGTGKGKEVTCKHCDGNGYRSVASLAEIRGESARETAYLEKGNFTFFANEENPNADLSFLCPTCIDGKTHETCNHCKGLGSREAYLDECFRDAMDAEALKTDSWVESGESDPCDLFLCRILVVD